MPHDEKMELHRQAAGRLEASHHLLLGAMREVELTKLVHDTLLQALPAINR